MPFLKLLQGDPWQRSRRCRLCYYCRRADERIHRNLVRWTVKIRWLSMRWMPRGLDVLHGQRWNSSCSFSSNVIMVEIDHGYTILPTSLLRSKSVQVAWWELLFLVGVVVRCSWYAWCMVGVVGTKKLMTTKGKFMFLAPYWISHNQKIKNRHKTMKAEAGTEHIVFSLSSLYTSNQHPSHDTK